MAHHRTAAALLLGAVVLAVPARAGAADKLLVAFHIDMNFGLFVMGDDRALGRDVDPGPLRYSDPYLSMMLSGGLQFRPHPIVAIDIESGFARWTGAAYNTSQMNVLCWFPDRSVFHVRNRLIPLEISVRVSVLEAPRVFLALCAGPGFYYVWRRTSGRSSTVMNSKGYGGGGKFSFLFGTKRAGPFEFNLELGFRFTRFAKMKAEGGAETGGFKPDFSGPFLGFRFLFGGGSADPAPPEPQPQPQPQPQPAPGPYTPPPGTVAPVPPSGQPTPPASTAPVPAG